MDKQEILKEVKKELREYSQLIRKAETLLNKTFILPTDNLTQENAKSLVRKYHNVISEVQKELLHKQTQECNHLYKKMSDSAFGSASYVDDL